jgi:hypothetical protein
LSGTSTPSRTKHSSSVPSHLILSMQRLGYRRLGMQRAACVEKILRRRSCIKAM